MPSYKAPERDYQFILNEVLTISEHKESLEPYQDVDESLTQALISEGAKLCEEVLFPLNQSGDSEGVHVKDGSVTLPKGFVDAYQTYAASGWTGLTADKKYGGQGLPETVNMPIIEMICSANLSFGMTPGLSHGAYNAIFTHASDALKDTYLPNMVSGKWSGVMCLTEPQCGTDLGLIRTTATPVKGDKDAYQINGSKIFISSGDQDATENIIHLILARLPDAPEGVKGISLFLAPKYKLKDDGSSGEANGITCLSAEEKMGIHASPTCVMNYDNAVGYLVGEPHKGLRAMFTMMNEARLYVGIQGLGLSEVSYQNAAAYARERLQGRALKGAAYPDKAADPLLVHPDIRRMLLTMRSFNEGARMLTTYTALKLDISKHHNDEAVREEADDFLQLMTPIMKAYFTDMGFECTNLGMQVLGGAGYIKEYGMEQYVRDARIAQIYEGANGVQALDLIGRKLPYHTGRYLRRFFHPATEFIDAHREHHRMGEFTKPLYTAIKNAQQASLWIAANGMGNPNEAAAGSSEYLRIMGIAALAYMWGLMAKTAIDALEAGTSDTEFYENKLATARFFFDKIVPQQYGLLASITAGSKSTMGFKEEAF